MKSFSRKKIVFIVLVGILIITALNFYQKEVRNFFYLFSSPIQKLLWRIGDSVSDFFETISEIHPIKSLRGKFNEVKNLKKENEEFKSRIQEILAQNIALLELKKENEVLRQALGIGLEKDFKLIFSRVIGKDISQDSLIIDKGLKDGVLEGQSVVTEKKILVGRISDVYKNFSRVMLISNKESSFDGKIVDRGEEEGKEIYPDSVYGLVKGKGNFKIFLDLVPYDKEIKKGDFLVTSSGGGIFPEGLLAGEVKEVKKSDIEPFQQIEISPLYDIKELKYLFLVSD